MKIVSVSFLLEARRLASSTWLVARQVSLILAMTWKYTADQPTRVLGVGELTRGGEP